MKRSSGPKVVVEHFKGLSDYPPKSLRRGYADFSPKSMGVLDLIGGNLNRLGGAIPADSISRPSIWSLGQLRFRDDWLVLTGGNQRELYSPGTPYINTPVEFKNGSGTKTDWDVRYEDDVETGTDPEGNPDYPIPPSVCHSWWSMRQGIFLYPVNDLFICQRTAGINLTGPPGYYATLGEAFDAAILWIQNPAYHVWSGWNRFPAGSSSLLAPFFRVVITVAYPGGVIGYNVKFGFQKVQQKPCSDTLAAPPNTPWGTQYENAYWNGGGYFWKNLDAYIGDPDVACTGTNCDTQESIVGEPELDVDALALSAKTMGLNTFRETEAATYDQALNSFAPTYGASSLVLWAEGGYIDRHTSHFGGE